MKMKKKKKKKGFHCRTAGKEILFIEADCSVDAVCLSFSLCVRETIAAIGYQPMKSPTEGFCSLNSTRCRNQSPRTGAQVFDWLINFKHEINSIVRPIPHYIKFIELIELK